MDVVLSAVMGDLASRLISFIAERFRAQARSSDTQSRLQLLLLRAGTVVEEADGRRVTNRGMLLQLKQLREAMYLGYYALDGSGAWQQTSTATRQDRLLPREMEEELEATLDGMKEFLLTLMHCPPTVRRQPYSSYMFMERCMFGRHAEKERITSFLLSHHPSSSSSSSSCLQVLPVVGPCYVGKTTLVEHVCMDADVRKNFPCILRFGGEDLSSLAVADGGDRDSEHRREKLLGLLSNGRCLITVELDREEDVVAWGELHRFLRRHGSNSRVILISRMEKVSSLGTVEAVKLVRLRQAEYWYFFRVLAFGSANPYDHHPGLASIGNEIAAEVDGYFNMTSIVTGLLRGNMSRHFWRRTLWFVRSSMRAHVLIFGEDPRHARSRVGNLSCSHTFRRDGTLVLFSIEKYEAAEREGLNEVKSAEEVLLNSGADLKDGEEFEVVSQSRIPPYPKHVAKCVVKKLKRDGDAGTSKCLKRKGLDGNR